MDVSSERPPMTAGLDLGDRYSYLCIIDQHNGDVIEEGRLRTSPEAFRRRFASHGQPIRREMHLDPSGTLFNRLASSTH
ncbi:MAG TPA: hypothetical protein VFI90_16520 [Rubrobacter sp.]|nr:hypothetical protein [Rubrobacter sp.]